MFKGTKYGQLSTIGIFIILMAFVLEDYIPEEMRFMILGFVIGWLSATWVVRFMILKEESLALENKRKKMLEEIPSITSTNKKN